MSKQILKEYGSILSKQVEKQSGPIAIERDDVIDQVLKQFDARKKSFLLVGPAGCGKTAILHEAIKRLNARNVPKWTVVQTSSSDLLRGTKYIGEWQSRVIAFAEAARADKHVAAVCSDIINLPAVGKWSQSDENMAMALKPFLEQDKLFLIGECDEEQFSTNIQTNPWFENCFTVIRVQPSSEEQCRRIVQLSFDARRNAFEKEHEVEIEVGVDALDAIDDLGRLYFPGTTPPSGAIRLTEKLFDSFRQQADELQPDDLRTIECSRVDAVMAIHSMTGLPTLLFDDSEKLDLTNAREYFETRVIGQTRAVNTIINLITLIKAGLNDPGKPLGVLFFVGPTGVGKTELAKKLAEFIFGSAERLLRLDMSEFKDYHAYEKLIGDSNTNKTSKSRGHLLASVRQQPFQVILLDEIEKAHSNIFDLLLQLFDDGRLSDARGNSVDFTQTIIILTSNIGSDLSSKVPIGFSGTPDEQDDEPILAAMRKVFRPELINRIDHVVPFGALQKEHVRLIARRELGQVLLRGGITRRHLRVDVQPGVIDILASAGFHPTYGARPLKRAVEKLALMPIARKIVEMKSGRQPAVLRLLPNGDKIALKVIYEKNRRGEQQTDKAELVDPVDGSRRKLSADQVGVTIDRVQEMVDFLTEESQRQSLADRKSEIVARTGAVDFWDNPALARKELGTLYQLERTLESIEQLSTQSRTIPIDFKRIRKSQDKRALQRLADQSLQLLNQSEILNYVLSCQDNRARADAFITITALEQTDDDHIAQLIEMYESWSKRKIFEARVIHEQLFEGSSSIRSAILLIEGVSVFGMLKNEHGIHEFLYDRTSQSEKRVEYVDVRVLPVPEVSVQPRIEVRSRSIKESGNRCPQLNLQIKATDSDSGVSVELTNGLGNPTSNSELETVAKQYLRSEILQQKELGEATGGDESETDKSIRRVTLQPTQSARDLRTGVTVYNLKEVWSGKIDDFLLAFIDSPLREKVDEARPTR